tara:strand:- start:382 stop:1074 length:693 start_codon:yes stop_codon:yes gene_type:complete
MFKKLIIAAISASFVASAAFADSTNIGLRISAANLAASGSETADSGSIGGGGARTTIGEKDASFELPSIFIERQIEMNSSLSMVFGLDLVPLTEDVASLGGGTGTDAKVKAGNLITAYVQPTFSVSDKISVYGKLGYAQGDLEISDITRQATATQANDAASIETNADKNLGGPVYGLGVQMNNDMGVFSFVRLEASRTDFDRISHTNSNGKLLTAEAEMDQISLTIGKSF